MAVGTDRPSNDAGLIISTRAFDVALASQAATREVALSRRTRAHAIARGVVAVYATCVSMGTPDARAHAPWCEGARGRTSIADLIISTARDSASLSHRRRR